MSPSKSCVSLPARVLSVLLSITMVVSLAPIVPAYAKEADAAGEAPQSASAVTVQEDPIEIETVIQSEASKASGDGALVLGAAEPADMETAEVSFKVTWDDGDNASGARPDSVTLHLFADGEDTAKTAVLDGKKDEAKGESWEKDPWVASFENLPKYAEGSSSEVEYVVKEDVDLLSGFGYQVKYEDSDSDQSGDGAPSGGAVINTLEVRESESTEAASTDVAAGSEGRGAAEEDRDGESSEISVENDLGAAELSLAGEAVENGDADKDGGNGSSQEAVKINQSSIDSESTVPSDAENAGATVDDEEQREAEEGEDREASEDPAEDSLDVTETYSADEPVEVNTVDSEGSADSGAAQTATEIEQSPADPELAAASEVESDAEAVAESERDRSAQLLQARTLAVQANTSELNYTVESDGSVTITGLADESLTALVIPASIDGHGVAKIDSSAFEGCGSLVSVELPDSLKTIGSWAFQGCALTSIDLPDSLESVGSWAFEDCVRLESVTLPDNAQWGCTLEGNVFSGCERLASVTVPASIKTDGCPFNSSGLTSATLAPGMREVPSGLFSGCASLASVTLPDAPTRIGSSAFAYCALTSIDLPDSLKTIGSWAFQGCALTSIDLPDSLESVGSWAFEDCVRLESVTLPDNAQWGCTLEGNVFSGCERLASVTVPASIKTDGCPFNSSGLTSATLAPGMREVPSDLFSGCASLASVTLPDSVTVLGSSAFAQCESLKNLVLPASVSTIGDWCFESTFSLTRLTMSSSVQNIGSNAFSNSAVTLYCGADTYAVVYAIENGIPFVITSSSSDGESLALDRSSSRYVANLDAISTNGYVSVSAKYGIKDSWKRSVSPSCVTICLPKGVDLDEDSLTLDGRSVTDYSLGYDERMLQVPVSKAAGTVRYQVRATSQEDFTSYAYLEMRKGGQDVEEVIGVINEPMSVLTLDVPPIISKSSFEVGGIAPPQSSISILVGGEEVASTSSSKAGSWSAPVSLASPQNYRTYEVKAVCYADSGELEQTAKTTYEQDAAEMNKFTVSYSENGKATTCDLLNSEAKPLIYYAPSQEFTFEVGYTHPEQIDALYVTSTRNGEKKYMQATYDPSKDAFVASGFFDPDDHDYVPGTLSVEYTKSRAEAFATEDFDWSAYSDYLPAETFSAVKNADGQYEAMIDLAEAYPDLIKESTKIGLAISDWKNETEVSSTFKDWLSIAETNDTILSYIVPGKDGKRYIFDFDYTDEDRWLMLVKDVADNKYLEIIINDVLDQTTDVKLWEKLSNASGYLSTAGTVAGILLKQKGIDSDIADLRKEVYGLGLSPAEEAAALKKVDQLHKDRTNFMLLSATIPLFMAAAGLSGPASLVLTGMLGVINASSSFFLDMRVGQITGGEVRPSWVVDPSGSVYDAVTNEPLDSVKVTAYWIESDGTSEFFNTVPAATEYGTLWDASEYDQENPLVTGGDGKYAWNVPEGWWRVKYERDGYGTQWSGWMTVPPIRTGVDVHMKRSISQATISAIASQSFTGTSITPKPSVKIGDTTLVEGTDYTVSYKNNTAVGTATVTITGKGGYSGSKKASFKINRASVSGASVTVAAQTYAGKALKPAPTVKVGGRTLKSGTDYTVSYKNNTAVGTATVTITGKGGYSGSKKASFKINRASVSGASVTVAAQTYAGKALKPAPTVKVGGRTLKSGTDYTVSYKNNVKAGTATAVVTGKGNFTGTKSATFKISKAKQPMTAKAVNKTVKYANVKKGAIALSKTVTVKSNQGALSYKNVSTQGAVKKFKVNAKNGTITVPKGTKKGTYKVKIEVTAKGNTNYVSGSKTVTVTIAVK